MPAPNPNSEDVALSLTLAIVSSSPGPLLLLDGHHTILAASVSFCDQFEASQTNLPGQVIYQYGAGEWDIPELRAMLTATEAGDAPMKPQELDFRQPGCSTRRLVVHVRRLAYLDLEQTRILVAVTDVTAARADAASKEAALRQNEVLLKEGRHRVANSLQIIASLLLQNARKTDCKETRGHLKDAHQRVMSVAALERLLSTSQAGVVEVHAYFTGFCESIAASMIGESDQISLTVAGGDGVVEARVSVALGLIVTELVINALKHAFPNGRRGKITVDYNFHGPNWVLCVRDDGVGMPSAGAAVRTGLGTTIVQALAAQLQASVEVVAKQPGTQVSIHHAQVVLVQDEPKTADRPLAATYPSVNAASG